MTPLDESARAPERGSQFLLTKNSLTASKDRIIADLLSGLLSMSNHAQVHTGFLLFGKWQDHN